MCAITILDKKEKREIGLAIRAKNRIIRETKQKPVNILYITKRPNRPNIRFFIKGSNYLFILITIS